MRAALAATLKKAFASTETALRPCVASKCLDFHLHHCHSSDPAEQRPGSSILGRDLPDIWAAPSAASPLLPPPELQSSCGNPISRLDSLRNNREQLVVIGFLGEITNISFCVIKTLIVDEELTPVIIDGKSIAEEIRQGLSEEVLRMKKTINKVPGLAVVLVGRRRDSQAYVRNKTKACEEVGMRSLLAEFPEDCGEEDVLNVVSDFNRDPSVHGVLVQLPLPEHLDEERILGAVSLEKDVDGFHPLNMGNLALSGREPLFIPCAAKACVELLLRLGVELKGKHVAVIGRSNVVGLPTSLLLQRHHATVSVLHAFTNNPQDVTREADIVISAAGVPNLVRGHWLKRGSVVIDVGTNPVEDPNSEQGYYLQGDVCYEEALQLASAITPVPGGVGPVTVAMLLANTLDSAKRLYGFT